MLQYVDGFWLLSVIACTHPPLTLYFFFGSSLLVRCYRHSGNENNLRAKLEDLIEIERIRSGKTIKNADKIMTFSDASRLLHSSIVVMRILGWSWRWAEWYVYLLVCLKGLLSFHMLTTSNFFTLQVGGL